MYLYVCGNQMKYIQIKIRTYIKSQIALLMHYLN